MSIDYVSVVQSMINGEPNTKVYRFKDSAIKNIYNEIEQVALKTIDKSQLFTEVYQKISVEECDNGLKYKYKYHYWILTNTKLFQN